MPYKHKELGTTAKDALEDVDSLLDSTLRALRRGRDAAYDGDTNAAGKAIAEAIDQAVVAQQIMALTLVNQYQQATFVLPKYRNGVKQA